MNLDLAPADVQTLFRKADAQRWGLTSEEFEAALSASVRRAFAASEPSARELHRYLGGLHVADLALATACALGRDAAWDHFVLQHRPVLYRAADALDPAGGAREIADSLYADLYQSLFRYFHGRSSLATWLRAVLSQRYVDTIRARRRLEPLPEQPESLPDESRGPRDPDRERLLPLVSSALRTAIAELPPKDRLRLRSYYLSQLTLAQTGRLTAEHEATVSRQLARTRRAVKDAVERTLRTAQLTDAQIARAVELVLEDPGGFDLQEKPDGSFQVRGND